MRGAVFFCLLILLGAALAAPVFRADLCDDTDITGYSMRVLYDAWVASENTTDVTFFGVDTVWYALCSSELEGTCDGQPAVNVTGCEFSNETQTEDVISYGTNRAWRDPINVCGGGYPCYGIQMRTPLNPACPLTGRGLFVDFHCDGSESGLGRRVILSYLGCDTVVQWFTDLACEFPAGTTTSTTTGASTATATATTTPPTSSDDGSGGDGSGDGGDNGTLFGAIGGGAGGVVLMICAAICVIPLCAVCLLACLACPLVVVAVVVVVIVLVVLAAAGTGVGIVVKKKLGTDDEMSDSDYDEEGGLSRKGSGRLRRSGSSFSASLAMLDTVRVIKVGDLELQQKIGEGNFGVVYRGKWRGTTDVAIKVIKLKGGDDEAELAKVREETEHEIAVMQRVGNHLNVVQFIGMVIDEEEGKLYTVTSYYPKGSMHDMLIKNRASNPTTHQDLVRMARDAAAGILHLHSEGVVHRDIAMRNCLVSEGGVVAISDFGTSRFFDADADDGGTTKNTMGPVRWMAPECLSVATEEDSRGATHNVSAYSKASDAWSFGVMLYEMAARDTPYSGIPLTRIAVEVARGTLRLQPPADAPPVFAEIMDGVFVVNPADRMTMKQAHRLLCRALNPETDSDSHESVAVPMSTAYTDTTTLMSLGASRSAAQNVSSNPVPAPPSHAEAYTVPHAVPGSHIQLRHEYAGADQPGENEN